MITISDNQLFAWIASFLLPLFRVLALMSTAPVFSSRAFPARGRVALAAAVALVAAPYAGAVDADAFAGPAALALIAREVLIGFAVGFSARLVFAAFELAGEAIGLQMGLSFAGFFDPQHSQANAVGGFIGSVSALAFVAVNGPLAVLATVIQTMQLFPVGEMSLPFLSANSPVAFGADVFALGLTIALPFIALLLYINVSLGVISRVAPQLNVFAVGFPVTIGAGLTLLTFGLPLIEAPLAGMLDEILTRLAH